MTKRREDKSATVPLAQQAEDAPRAADIRWRWRWVEPAVWTLRMLTALETEEQGAKWFRLYDKVMSERNLLAALQQVARNDGAAGVDHVTIEEFAARFPESIWEVADALKEQTYAPQAIRRVHLPKPGSSETRPLGIPTVRDRIVQAAVVNVIEPIFERGFAEHSYGFRPGRGCHNALDRVHTLLKQGYTHVVDADLKGYFDSIPQDRLLERVGEKIADGSVRRLIERFLQAEIMDGTERWTPEAGAPQGAVLSPLLSNIYLNPLDHLLAQSGIEMVRYADDFVLLCRTAEKARQALEVVRQWVTENGLTLHPDKTRIVDASVEKFDFLGFTFCADKHWPRKKSLAKLKDTIRTKTPRTSGRSLKCVIAKVNQTLHGWFAYFQRSDYRNVFSDLDPWIRMRLRSILRKRAGRVGRGRGQDHHRWPNAFFTEQGLYSLCAAYDSVRQPSPR